MPLEDLSGSSKYISNLNSDWPAGTDYPDAGDNHIRGIKNVLKRTFPNVAGVVSRDHTSLSQGSVPIGSILPFFQATAPVNWARLAGIADTKLMRVVASVSAGGGSGGTNDPILNDKIGSHTHTVSGSVSSESAHTHSLPGVFKWAAGVTSGERLQVINTGTTAIGVPTNPLANVTGAGATHNHAGTALVVAVNAGAANWTPRYLDMILCQRTN